MNNIQDDFNSLQSFLHRYKENNPLAKDLEKICRTSEVEYKSSSLKEHDKKPNKSDLISQYEVHLSINEKKKEKNLIKLHNHFLENLRKTDINYICISSILSETGSYLIFSDYEKKELIGILKYNKTLTEIRESFDNHNNLLAKYNCAPHERKTNIFVNGLLVDRK